MAYLADLMALSQTSVLSLAEPLLLSSFGEGSAGGAGCWLGDLTGEDFGEASDSPEISRPNERMKTQARISH